MSRQFTLLGYEQTTSSTGGFDFFYQGESGADTADAVVTLGMNSGGFVNHTGGSWHQICTHSLNTWYDIVMVLDIGNSEYELSIVDENGKESNFTLPFRNSGDGVEDRIKLLKLGTDKEGADITWQYIKIKELGTDRAPQIDAERTTYSAVLSETRQVVLDYDVIGEPEPEVRVADHSDGVTVAADCKTVSFTEAGTYTVTIEAENSLGKVSKVFTINVREDAGTYLDTGFNENPGFTFTDSGEGNAEISNGVLSISTGSSSSSAFARYDFGSTLEGNILAEIVITDTSTGSGMNSNFINLLFLYTTGTTSNDTSRCAFSLGIDDGVLAYHTGSGWKNETTAVVPQGRPVTISVLMNFEDAVYSVYMDEEPTALMNIGFRNPSLKNDVSVLYIGSDKLTSVVSYDSMKFVQVTPPSIEMEETASVDLDIDSNFALNYAVSPSDAQVSVICDKTSGWSWQDGKENEAVTFTAAGTYVFTVTAASSGGSVSKTITVTVTGSNLAPEIDVTSEDGNIVLQSADGYILSYNVTGSPLPEIVLSETNENGGWVYDESTGKITFSKTGYYEFLLQATNIAGKASDTFAVTVSDRFENSDSILPFWSVTFGTDSAAEFDEATTEGGLVNWTEAGVNVALNGNGSAFIDKKFDQAFSGIVVTEITFTENVEGVGGAFTNLLFFYTSNSSGALGSNAMGVAVRNEYNALIWSEKSSAGWMDFYDPQGVRVDLKINTEYTLKVVNDFDNKVSYFYLSGEGVNYIFDETYLGSHVFRNTSLENIDRLRVGSDKAGTDFTVKSIVMRQFDENVPEPVAPTVTVNEAEKVLTLSSGTAVYVLDYTVSPADAEVTIACDQQDGFERDENAITFTMAGTYVFTITAVNAEGTDFGTITVTVEEEVILQGPEFTKPQSDIELTLQEAKRPQYCEIVLDFEVTGTDVTVAIEETTRIGAWVYDAENKVLTFAKGGEYKFRIFAKDANGLTAENTFAAKVTDLYEDTSSASSLYNWNFDQAQAPDGWTEEKAEAGTITYSEEGVTLNRPGSGSAFLTYAFDQALSGVVEIKIDFKITQSGFANVLFLRGANNKYPVAVAVQNGELIVNENNTWLYETPALGNTRTRLVADMQYTLRAIVDFDGQRIYLYLSGESIVADGADGGVGEPVAFGENIYLMNIDFRENGAEALAYRMGSDNTTTQFTVYGISIAQVAQSAQEAVKPIWQPDLTAQPADAIVTQGEGGTVTFDEGGVHFNAVGTKGIYFDKQFDFAMNGIVITDVTFVSESEKGFANLIFFQASASATASQCVAIENGNLRYHSGSWKTFQYNGSDVSVAVGSEYTLRIVNDFVSSKIYYFLTGNVNGQELTNAYLGTYNFRTADNENVVYLRSGSNKDGTKYSIRDLKVYKTETPVLIMDSAYSLITNGTLELTTLNQANSFEVICAEGESGWNLEGSTLTFTQAGTYTLTVTATGARGESETVTIAVTVADAA